MWRGEKGFGGGGGGSIMCPCWWWRAEEAIIAGCMSRISMCGGSGCITSIGCVAILDDGRGWLWKASTLLLSIIIRDEVFGLWNIDEPPMEHMDL